IKSTTTDKSTDRLTNPKKKTKKKMIDQESGGSSTVTETPKETTTKGTKATKVKKEKGIDKGKSCKKDIKDGKETETTVNGTTTLTGSNGDKLSESDCKTGSAISPSSSSS